MTDMYEDGIPVSGDLIARNESIRELFEFLTVDEIGWLGEGPK